MQLDNMVTEREILRGAQWTERRKEQKKTKRGGCLSCSKSKATIFICIFMIVLSIAYNLQIPQDRTANTS